MLVPILIAMTSFALGALITGVCALGVIGILYREAASMVDSYVNREPLRAVSPHLRGRAGWTPHIVAGGGGCE